MLRRRNDGLIASAAFVSWCFLLHLFLHHGCVEGSGTTPVGVMGPETSPKGVMDTNQGPKEVQSSETSPKGVRGSGSSPKGVPGKKARPKGEFLAGTFIITQKSLNEAPYRYAGVLRKALDKAEGQDPPTQLPDESVCDVRYKITPSGKRSKLDIIPDTLSLTLKHNNTVVIAAKIDAQVSARAWIWKGINFGLLGCLKISSCAGHIVTYSATIDTQVAFSVHWDKAQDRLAVFIKPVETSLHDVNVAGCKPPWFLWWFKKWQSLLNEKVQDAFQEFANSFEHQAEVPDVFEPFKNVYIHHRITGLDWTPDYVMLEARAVVQTSVGQNGVNITFIPETTDEDYATPIPMGGWNMTSPDDYNSHLLQGVRLTTEFFNSIMWYATMTNVTEYRGGAKILDSIINGTVSYTPPEISVKRDNLLNVHIDKGLILAICRPTDDAMTNQTAASVLFKAEFSNLAGSGQIRLASTDDKTGIRVSLDQLDLDNLDTKPFEPKLPLPEAFEGDLVKSAIAQLQPVVNEYLSRKPLYLPKSIEPLAASPQLQLVQTGNGTGYAELLSYCTCDTDSGYSFAVCDSRSQICTNAPKSPPVNAKPKLPAYYKKLHQGVSNILKVAHQTMDRFGGGHDSNPKSSLTKLRATYKERNASYSALFSSIHSNSSYRGIHLTVYADSNQCNVKESGSYAKVYWLWEANQCLPVYLQGVITMSYYQLSTNGSLLFECSSDQCDDCQYHVPKLNQTQRHCHQLGQYQSLHVGEPYIYSWVGMTVGEIVSNVFFTESPYCAYEPQYFQPQMVSAHTNLGRGYHTNRCRQLAKGQYVRNQVLKTDQGYFINRAHWDCEEHCFDCGFQLSNVGLDNCHSYKPKVQVRFTQTIKEHILEPTIKKSGLDLEKYVIAGCSGAMVFFASMVSACLLWKNQKKLKEKTEALKDFSVQSWVVSTKSSMRDGFAKNLGFRLANIKKKYVKQDIMQNLLLLGNGCLAIVFADRWNSDTNPLRIIHSKFKSGISISINIFETESVLEFASQLNFYTSLCNNINAGIAFALVLAWTFTTFGSRRSWIKLRLLSAFCMLSTTFIVLAGLILTTYFDELVVLKQDSDSFITENPSVNKFFSRVIKVSLNGVSLTVVSFTMVFLFHGVGGGLYCGTVLFRITEFKSKRSNLEILTTLLVILTVIQPFICLHPVIIWCQDSHQNSTFLILVVLMWFLPVCVHVLGRIMANNGLDKLKAVLIQKFVKLNHAGSARMRNSRVEVETGSKARSSNKQGKSVAKVFDLAVQLFQLATFLATFSLITHHIVNLEFEDQGRRSLQDFVLPAIISVFTWMVSLSYMILSLVLDDSQSSRVGLVFTDQNLESARTLLRQSLRRRLNHLDRHGVPARNTSEFQRSRSLRRSVQRPREPPPDPPARKTGWPGNQEEQQMESFYKPHRRAPDPPPPDVAACASSSSNGLPIVRFKKPPVPPKPLHLQNTRICNNSVESLLHQEGKGGGGQQLQPPEEDINSETLSDFDESTITIQSSETASNRRTGCWQKAVAVYHFVTESREYRDPQTHGWRIKFRRIFLVLGVIFFTYQTIFAMISTQKYSSKHEIQRILDYAGTNLTWPDSGSVLDDVFLLYNEMERTKTYMMIVSTILFWTSLVLDFCSFWAKTQSSKSFMFTGSRVTNFVGSLCVFASVMIVGLPDYLEASNLDKICPFCGHDFNRTVRQIAEFSIGLFFACLFTFRLIPILVTIAPALVRASVLILIHPSLQAEAVRPDESGKTTHLRMTILQQVTQFSSFLTFPITFISMSILQQYQKDVTVTLIIIGFWVLPPFVLYLGLYFSRKYHKHVILLYVYYLYNFSYVALLSSLVFYSMTLEKVLEALENLIQEPSFWAGSFAQIFLCNVVISDMLYMTVF